MRESDGPVPGASPAAGVPAHPPPAPGPSAPVAAPARGGTREIAGRGRRGALAGVAFASLGAVFGDIGTSPLYALRACFNVALGGVPPAPANVYGVLSLVLWSLILVITVKYIAFIMRADNRGEGGILALLALAAPVRGRRMPQRRALVVIGLLGTALLYGDGMIMPAISVLGALEGLERAAPAAHPFILPLSAAVLFGLFSLQRGGTPRGSALFAPVTLLWFAAIALLGAWQIARAPHVLAAVNPLEAVRFFMDNGLRGFLTLGFVFLVVTGGEALYADMGYFGRRPIRLAWLTLVLPALVLNYFGQGALLLADPRAASNPFYALVPDPLLYPMVALATAAAVVASQSLITGVFSITQQALQLGYIPRVQILHASGELAERIFVPSVNRALMLASIALVLGFRTSGDLAAAYGIAVSGTMAITTILFHVVLRARLGWRAWPAGLLTAAFLLVDLSFFGANIVKVDEGGWFPLAVGAVVFLLMWTWLEGRLTLLRIGQRQSLPLDLLIEDLQRRQVPRLPGTAVFMTPDPEAGAPLVLLHHLKHNKALHERVVLLAVQTEDVPVVREDARLGTRERGAGFTTVVAHYGFMETPDVPRTLAGCSALQGRFSPAETTYYLGRHTLVPTGRSSMARWRKELFMFMYRNARPATRHYELPANRVVEMGAQVPF